MRIRSVSLIAVLAVGLGPVAVPAGASAAPPVAASAATGGGGTVVAGSTVALPGTTVAAAAERNALAAAAKKKKKKTVALTFDDGPSDYTYQVLDILKKHKVKATFCVVGDNVGRYPKTTARIVREGHRLCNHTRDHANLTKLTPAQVRKELTDAQAQIKAVTRVTPKVVRFPYGASNKTVRSIAKKLKLRSIGWDVDSLDWKNPKAKTITARIVKKTRSGDIVLLHDGGGDRRRTVASLAATIKKLKQKGYRFVLA